MPRSVTNDDTRGYNLARRGLKPGSGCEHANQRAGAQVNAQHEPSPPPPPTPPSPWRYAGMGMELAGAIVGFTLVGFWVDYHYQSRPVGTLVGAGLGTVGGLYNLIREALAMSRNQDVPPRRKDDHHDGRPPH